MTTPSSNVTELDRSLVAGTEAPSRAAAVEASSAFHVPSLDGLRGVAVSIVVLSHTRLGKVVPGGFGVTIFFFLSGYLITTLLRRELERHGRICLESVSAKTSSMSIAIRLLIGCYLSHTRCSS
jgi:peptidoglycan/LPS O-acetylase OafA/YrhL